MWFIIRAAFCVGIVFSMTPGAEKAGDAVNLPALATSLTSEATQGVVDAALQTCKNDPKFCFEMAFLLGARSVVLCGFELEAPAYLTLQRLPRELFASPADIVSHPSARQRRPGSGRASTRDRSGTEFQGFPRHLL